MKVISKSAAKAAGLKRYYTGKPCRRGHTSERLVANGNCCECKRLRGEAWEEKNRKSRNARDRERYWANRERKLRWRRAYEARRMRSDPEFSVACMMRSMVGRVLRDAAAEKGGSSAEVLGYSAAELVRHLESQFEKGMSWSNREEWHVDHIVPVSELIRVGETDPSVVNCLSNLRPMWAADNIRKSDQRTHLI